MTIARGREPERDPEYVWIWKAKAKRNFEVLGGQTPLEEDFSVTVRVVAIGGEDPETRAFDLQEAAEAALRGDVTLGDVVYWHRLEEIEDEPLEFDTKLGWAVLMTLTGRARI